MMAKLHELAGTLLFQGGHNTSVVLIGVTLLGAAAGLVGALALLRKRALMGDALAHATLPGIAGAFLLATFLAPVLGLAQVHARSLAVLLAGAAVSAIIGILVVQAIRAWTRPRLHEDTAIAVVLSTFFGAGYVLLGVIQQFSSEQHAGLKTFILGQAAAMSVADLTLMAWAAGAALVICGLLYKEFRVVCFDEGFARAQGWPVSLLDMAMMGLVVLVTVVGLQAVGLVLVIALLIIPAAAARFWSDRLGVMLLLSAVFGAVSGYVGSGVSAIARGMPTGAIVVLVCAGVFVLSSLAAPRRGLAAQAVRRVRLNRRISLDHALRALYELAECSENGRAESVLERPIEEARATTALRSFGRTATIGQLVGRGYIERSAGRLLFTPAGGRAAAGAVRLHRLWERYLVAAANVPVSHAHHPADFIEHADDPELIAELERALDVATSQISGAAVKQPPPSVHPIVPPG